MRLKLPVLMVSILMLPACGKHHSGDNKGGGNAPSPTFAEYDSYTTYNNPSRSGARVRATVRIEKINDQTAKVTLAENGNAPQNIQEFSLKDMPTREQIEDLMKDCSHFSAVPDSVDTAAGKISACFYEQAGQKTWYGAVPFMIVKRIGKETVNGEIRDVEMTLKSYNW